MSKPKYYLYLSKTKIDMLYRQYCRGEIGLSQVSPKISVAGIEASVGFEREKPTQNDIFTKAQKTVSVLEKKELVKSLDNSELRTQFFTHDEGQWHSGILTNIAGILNSNSSASSEDSTNNVFSPFSFGAYINFKIHNDNLILLIGSFTNLIGFQDNIHLDSTFPTPTPSTMKALEIDLPMFIGMYAMNDQADRPEKYSVKKVPTIPTDSTYGIMLGEFSLQKFTEYPQRDLEILFKVYQKVNLRKKARDLSKLLDDINPDYAKWLKGKIKDIDLLRFHHLYIGSPIYTALS